MYTLVAVSGLLSPSAFVRLPEMRISVLHKGHSILFHLLDFISVLLCKTGQRRFHMVIGCGASSFFSDRLSEAEI
jgi:hypothetical protein